MRTRRGSYGIQGSYARYGLTRERAEGLLRECMEGKHTELVREAARQADPCLAKWIILSITEGKSLHDMQVKWELGEAEVMPCSRNSFYSYRKLTIAILDSMLSGKGAGEYGQL